MSRDRSSQVDSAPASADGAAASGMVERSADTPAGARAAFVWRVLDYTRVVIVVVLLALVVFAVPAQGRDMTSALSSEGAWVPTIAFVFGVLALSLQAWFWARLMLDDRFERRGLDSYARLGDDPKLTGLALPVLRWLPRSLALFLTLGAACLVFWSAGRVSLLGFLLVGLAVVELLFLRRRRTAGRERQHDEKQCSERKTGDQAGFQWSMDAVRRAPLDFEEWLKFLTPLQRIVVIFSIAVTAVAVALSFALPVRFGLTFGAGAVALFSLCAILLVLQSIVFLLRSKGLPIGRVLLGLFVLSGLSGWALGENHGLRTTGSVPPTRPSVAEELARWDEFNGARARPTNGVAPLVLVATAGGGLRAAYFTALVLSTARDLDPEFDQKVFAISGASGGAVGATAWVTWLRSLQLEGGGGVSAKCQTWAALAPFFDEDYLGPTLEGLLTRDLAQRFIPLPLITDRAAYLERGWESGFEQAARKCDRPLVGQGLGAPFLSLWQGRDRWLPHLLNNGTHQELGIRIITSGLATTPAEFPESIDFYDTQKQSDIPISTAAHNAARFPLFSPSGRLGDGTGHIVDGGYLENFGAQTALDLLWAVRDWDPRAERVRPVIVQILNDSGIHREFPNQVVRKAHASVFTDVLGVPGGLLAAREGRAREAGSQLARWAREPADSGTYVQLRLFKTPGGREPAPLGWVLSREARAEMDRQLCAEANRRAFEELVSALGADAGGVAALCRRLEVGGATAAIANVKG